MAFTVQDDTGGVVDANAYITVAFLKSYHLDRGQALTPNDDPSLQTAIVRATTYLDTRFQFIGQVPDPDQSTQWPRIGAVDSNDRYRDGVPREIKNATAEYARIALSKTLNPVPTQDEYGASVKSRSERAGPVSSSVTYADGSVVKLPKYPPADQWLISSGLVDRSGRIHLA